MILCNKREIPNIEDDEWNLSCVKYYFIDV